MKCDRIYNMCFAHTYGLLLTRSFRVHTSTRPLTWLGGSSVRIPLTRTGPHTRTHSMPIKHIVPPLIHIHTHSMSNSTCTPHAHRTCAHRAQRAYHKRLDASPATASLTSAYIRLRSKLIYLLVSCRAGKEEARSYWHYSTTTTPGEANDGSCVKPQQLA